MKNTMNFSKFANAVEAIVSAKLAPLQVSTQSVLKANQQLTGLIIRDDSTNAAPAFYLDNFYHDYVAGLLTAEDVADKICSAYDDARAAAPLNAVELCSFAAARDKICFKLISSENNREYLKTVPFRVIDDTDLVAVYYIQLNESASVPITNSLMSLYEIDEAELYELARRNTPRLAPVKLNGLFATLTGMLNTEDIPFDVIEPDEDESIFVLSNKAGLFGAASILYDDVLKQFAEKRGDFYLLPSSLHEMLLVPTDGLMMNPNDLLEMVTSVNATEVSASDKLSDHVYYYSAGAGFITMCK